MTSRLVGVLAAGAAALMLTASGAAAQQTEFVNNFKYNKGQSVQPVFEGWSWAPDGSINMHFGYLNRNYVQEPTIPIGPDNNIQPGGPDRGQPTYFYTRTNRNLFTVNVPKDWDKKREVVWTLTVNGRTERAVGWLQTEWEIDPVGGAGGGGGNTSPERLANKAPSVAIAPVPVATVRTNVTLTTTVTDDGLPKPQARGKPPVGQETPPTLQGGEEAPVNVPEINARAIRETPPGATANAAAVRPPNAIHITWLVWRGPADAFFTPKYSEPKDGKTTTTVSFTTPGEYVLRAVVTDTFKSSTADVTVTVK
ncbi:MAG: hypothetical protein AB7O32_11225 [Vicinamibacterales bacterium]